MGVTDEDVQAAIDSGEWVQKEDKKTGKTYYSNKKTKATTWDLKKELAKQQKEGGDDGGGKKEKKEKKDKGEKKEKKEKKDKKAAAAEEEEAAEKPKDKDKDKKSKKDDKKKEEEKKEEKPAAAKKDAAKKKDDADKTSQAGLGSRKASVVSNVSKGADSMASVISNTPFIMPSDDLSRGNYMTAVTLETDKGVLDGPEMVYGWTDKECRLAASLRREQMRQKHFDKMSLRDYLGAHDDPNSNVVAADYFEGDGFGGAYAVGGLGGGSPGGGGPLGVIRTSLSPRGGGGSPRSAHTQYEKTYDANPFLTYKTRPYPHSPPRSHHHHAASERSDDADLEAGRDGALRAAAACGDVGAAVSLLRSGLARVNEPRADGKTALHHAARYGHVDMVGLLLEAGADWRLRDAKGRTPADLARQLGQRAAAARLDAVAGQPHTPSAAAAAAAATPSPLRGASPPRPYPPTQHQQPRHLRTSFYDPGLTGAPAPPAAMSPGEQTRQLKADVGEAMSGVTSLVRGWIREWAPDGGAPQQQQQQQQHPPRTASPGGYGYGGGPPPPPPQHPVHSGPLNPQPQPAYHPYQQQPQRFGEPPSAEGRISPMRRGGAGGGGAASIGLSPRGLPPSAAAGPYAGGGGYQPPLPGAAPRGRAPSPPQEMVDELTAAIWAASKGGGGGGAGSMPPPPQQQQHPLPPSPLPPQFPPPAAAFRPSTSPPPPQYRRPDAYLLPNEGVDI